VSELNNRDTEAEGKRRRRQEQRWLWGGAEMCSNWATSIYIYWRLYTCILFYHENRNLFIWNQNWNI